MPQSPAPLMSTLDASKPISFQRIMLATDFGPMSESALHYSLSIARRYNAKVYLMHVVRPDLLQFGSGAEARQRALDDAWRDAQRHMTDLLIAGHLEGVDHQVLVEQGDVWEVLSDKINVLAIDLLVIGTHGRGRLGKLLLGSVAETIFRQAACPVMMVGPKAIAAAEQGPDRILYCTGFSAHSIKAGNYALSLAQHQSASLMLMTVRKEFPASAAERELLMAESRTRLQSLLPAAHKLDSPPEFLVEFGTAADRILTVAGERHPGLIVLGVRQPVGFARRIKWATAYEVVCDAPCPVLTVRMPEPA
jgi:nucleotide-binding universal stress UspA family protein